MPQTDENVGFSSTNINDPMPNIWSSMQRWIDHLPSRTSEEARRRQELQNELSWCYSKLNENRSTSEQTHIFGHCDLLCGNILILSNDKPRIDRPDAPEERNRISPTEVRFIDFEFAMHCPAAFDIANHFSEWGGFDCDYNMLPGRVIRQKFIDKYLASYIQHANITLPDFASAASKLAYEVNMFRGIPGLWWGIRGFVSVLESKIDFDWIPYANKRLAEYWGWKAEAEGLRDRNGEEMTLREKMWDRD